MVLTSRDRTPFYFQNYFPYLTRSVAKVWSYVNLVQPIKCASSWIKLNASNFIQECG